MSKLTDLNSDSEKEYMDKVNDDFAFFTEAYPSISIGDLSTSQTRKLRTTISNDGTFNQADIFFELMRELQVLKQRGFPNAKLVVSHLYLTANIISPEFCPRRGFMMVYNIVYGVINKTTNVPLVKPTYPWSDKVDTKQLVDPQTGEIGINSSNVVCLYCRM
jgi:hypothetical protein